MLKRPNPKRDEAIRQAHKNGTSIKDLATEYKLTGMRIYQIVNKRKHKASDWEKTEEKMSNKKQSPYLWGTDLDQE